MGLPDPRLMKVGPTLASGATNFLFNRGSTALPTPLPPQPFQPRVKLPDAGPIDALTAKAGAASRAIERVGPNSQASMAAAMRAVTNFNNNPASFDGTRTKAGAASRSLDLIGNSAAANSQRAIGAFGNVQGAINNLHGKELKITTNTQDAINNLQRLQQMQIEDKSFQVTQFTNVIERSV
jgi:hypothetical protein